VGRANKVANKFQKRLDNRIAQARKAIKMLLKNSPQKAKPQDKKPSKKPKNKATKT
jgi:hypothetical protein